MSTSIRNLLRLGRCLSDLLKQDGQIYDLVDPMQLEDPRRNLFSANSFTLVVGDNGAGKTHFLSGLANGVMKKGGSGIVREEGGRGDEYIVFRYYIRMQRF